MKILEHKLTWCFAFLTAVFLLFGSSVEAQSRSGTLEVAWSSGGDEVLKTYDRDMLEELGVVEIMTDTPWTDGVINFTGVLLRDLMDVAGATDGTARAIALNDYSIEIPIEDFLQYDVILAFKRDGNYLTVRDKGPYWVIYPWRDTPSLRTELHHSRSIWQLRRIEFNSN